MAMPETLQELTELNTSDLWTVLIDLLDEEDENGQKLMKHYQKKYEKIKNGIKLKFTIYKCIKGHIISYPDKNLIEIRGTGRVNETQYYDEIEERKKLMRKIITEQMDESSTTEPRN